MKKSIAVLGLGRYGRSISENLYEMGADVLVVDQDEKLVSEFSSKCTSALVADLTVEDEVASLGLKDMDIVVVSMADNLSASIMSIAVAKEQNVPLVVAKASSDRMASILLKVGADKILDPEGEGGFRSARILLSSSFNDFFKIDDNMYMVEMKPKKEWVGKSLVELDLRGRANLNVVAARSKGEMWHFIDPKKTISENTILLIVMERKDMGKWH
ncbi:MAG: TrkA family potassium uptake protein [Lachnospiraceae bacterium]|nr:TrkA family potassium uptake protein [Lachnospiraceae bacterium]